VVQGLALSVVLLVCRVQSFGLGFRVYNSGFVVQGLAVSVSSSVCRVQSFGSVGTCAYIHGVNA